MYSLHTPSDEIVDLEGRVCIEDGDGDPSVEKDSLNEHPSNVGQQTVVDEDVHRLAQPVLQKEQQHETESHSIAPFVNLFNERCVYDVVCSAPSMFSLNFGGRIESNTDVVY